MTIFRRRQPRTTSQKARELVWPSAGWRRAGKYFWYRIVRMPGTPYSIAAGLACGVAVSFTPFLGIHFILAAIFAWIIRANLLASAIGTAAGNPYSFPFIWVLVYNVGIVILGWEGQSHRRLRAAAGRRRAGGGGFLADLVFSRLVWYRALPPPAALAAGRYPAAQSR